MLNLSTTPLEVEQDATRLRPSDVPEIVSDCRKFRSLTGWQAEIPLEESLRDILDWWRAQIRH
jgi:GDP-4-dehydro-6-deoxy-D-mannose reductase